MFLQRRNILKLLKKLYNPLYKDKTTYHAVQLPETNKSIQITSSDFDEEIHSKILYSSFLESQKFKLGYAKKKIIQSLTKKREYEELVEKTKERPFSVASKYLEVVADNIKEDFVDSSKTAFSNIISNQPSISDFPKLWLDEYEFYDGDEKVEHSKYGSNDPNIPPSTVPCSGCGAHLHCADPGIPGYIPCEIFKGRTDNELKTIICQRCHFLKHYNIALDITVKPEDYVETLSSIKYKHALVVLIVDLLDFPCSIWSNIKEIVGEKRPVILVGNKLDLLPKDSKGYIDNIKNTLTQVALDSGLNKLNLKKTCLISAKTGYGIEELITLLHKIWKYDGDVYLVGCANVGKSSLFNAMLRSDYCKVEASDLVKKATTCPWPGTTIKMLKFPILRPSDIRVYERFQRLRSANVQRQAEEKLRRDQLKSTGKIKDATLTGHIGRTFKNLFETNDPFCSVKSMNPILTLDEKNKLYAKSKWCYDTPGVMNPEQIHNLLTTEELLLTNPTEMITPRAYRISEGMTLFLAGLGRFDFISGDLKYIKLYVFSSLKLPILITRSEDAGYIYDNLLGLKYLRVPLGNSDRLKKWPKLESSEIIIEGSEEEETSSDILLSSAGWISLKLLSKHKFKFLVWSPEKRGIFLRKPALVRYPEKLCGAKIRNSLAYKIGKPFILTTN